jgi:hypothetical protein
VGRFLLVDSDIVEASNIARSTYEASDIGESKANALRRQLLRIRPRVNVEGYANDLQELDINQLYGMIGSADLVLALTDDPHGQSVLNRLSYGANTPAIFAALYVGAQGGEVIMSIPGRTPCYSCSTGYRRESLATAGFAVDRPTDYGTARLAGEMALACDIHHLDSVTVKLSLGVLASSQSSVAAFVDGALSLRLSYFVSGMVPNYFFFPDLFRYHTAEEVPGQYAFQSAWLSPSTDPDCPVCGSHRRDPLATPIRRGPQPVEV